MIEDLVTQHNYISVARCAHPKTKLSSVIMIIMNFWIPIQYHPLLICKGSMAKLMYDVTNSSDAHRLLKPLFGHVPQFRIAWKAPFKLLVSRLLSWKWLIRFGRRQGWRRPCLLAGRSMVAIQIDIPKFLDHKTYVDPKWLRSHLARTHLTVQEFISACIENFFACIARLFWRDSATCGVNNSDRNPFAESEEEININIDTNRFSGWVWNTFLFGPRAAERRLRLRLSVIRSDPYRSALVFFFQPR